MRALLILLLVAQPALADPTPEEVARAHYVSAQAYYKQGRAAEALREFQEAYRIAPRPAFHYNIAICHEKLGHDEEAIVAYQQYLEESPDAADREAVQDHVDQLRARHPAPAPVVAPPEASPSPMPIAPPPAPVLVEQPRSHPVRAWVWGLTGGGLAIVTAGIIIGVVVGTSGGSSSSSVKTLPPVTLQ